MKPTKQPERVIQPAPTAKPTYTGKAWSVVHQGNLYVPVELTIDHGTVVDVKVGDGDTFAAAEGKATNYMRVWAKS